MNDGGHHDPGRLALGRHVGEGVVVDIVLGEALRRSGMLLEQQRTQSSYQGCPAGPGAFRARRKRVHAADDTRRR